MPVVILLVLAAPPVSIAPINTDTPSTDRAPNEAAIAASLKQWTAKDGAQCRTYPGDAPLNAVHITASSYQTWRDKHYRPQNIFDGDYKTAWVENKKGDGLGEWAAIGFVPTNKVVRLIGVLVVSGFAKNAYMFARNNRPQHLRLESDCADAPTSSLLLELEDRRTPQLFVFPGAVTLAADRPCKLTFTIEAVYRGSHYRDTSLAEARLLFR